MEFKNSEVTFHIYSLKMIKRKGFFPCKRKSLKRKLSKTDLYKTFASVTIRFCVEKYNKRLKIFNLSLNQNTPCRNYLLFKNIIFYVYFMYLKDFQK